MWRSGLGHSVFNGRHEMMNNDHRLTYIHLALLPPCFVEFQSGRLSVAGCGTGQGALNVA